MEKKENIEVVQAEIVEENPKSIEQPGNSQLPAPARTGLLSALVMIGGQLLKSFLLHHTNKTLCNNKNSHKKTTNQGRKFRHKRK